MNDTKSTKTPTLDRIERNLENLDLNALGRVAVDDIKKNFLTSGGNIGKKWPSIEERKGLPLLDTKQLYHSIRAIQSENSIKVISNKFSNGVDIAAVHNNGSRKKNIPKREFMKFSNSAIREFSKLIKEAVLK